MKKNFFKSNNIFHKLILAIVMIVSILIASLVLGQEKNINSKDIKTRSEKVSSKTKDKTLEEKWVRTEPAYHRFTLVKGKGVEVCEAYLERLNKTWFERVPFCDRPENTNVPGFEKLNRVDLTAEEIYPINHRIRDFLQASDQYRHERQQTYGKTYEVRPVNKEEEIALIKQGLEYKQLGAFRYYPLIDLDNDERPDNLLVWKKSGFSCGTIHEEYGRFPQGGSTIVLVMSPDSQSIDEMQTKQLLRHPVGGYPKPDGKGFFEGSRFRPVGDSMGIFRYKGITYFDTFFNGWGDFEGKRSKSPDIGRTLGVFKREKGQTKQVCEYLWEIPYEQNN